LNSRSNDDSKTDPAMKRRLTVLLALPLLLGACSSFTRSIAQRPEAPAPVRLADRASAWGELPSYDQAGQFFEFSVYVSPSALSGDGTVSIDLLVDRDGSVQEAAIVSSSGHRQADDIAMMLYRNARYSLRLGDGDPAPYVVSQTVVLSSVARDAAKNVDYGRDHHEGPTYTEAHSSEAPNTVHGFPR
jgi:TonB family protein